MDCSNTTGIQRDNFVSDIWVFSCWYDPWWFMLGNFQGGTAGIDSSGSGHYEKTWYHPRESIIQNRLPWSWSSWLKLDKTFVPEAVKLQLKKPEKQSEWLWIHTRRKGPTTNPSKSLLLSATHGGFVFHFQFIFQVNGVVLRFREIRTIMAQCSIYSKERYTVCPLKKHRKTTLSTTSPMWWDRFIQRKRVPENDSLWILKRLNFERRFQGLCRSRKWTTEN